MLRHTLGGIVLWSIYLTVAYGISAFAQQDPPDHDMVKRVPQTPKPLTMQITPQERDALLLAGQSCLGGDRYVCAEYALFVRKLLTSAKE